jgi:adenylate kinase
MRACVTGQVGVDKGPYLEQVKALAISRGLDLEVCHVGQMMYREAPDVPAGRILNLPITRLNALRRAVFKEIQSISQRHEHVILNTHATFRWRHGLFSAFDFDQIKHFEADCYITLIDNVETIHQRLLREHDIDHSLKDILVWREEEFSRRRSSPTSPAATGISSSSAAAAPRRPCRPRRACCLNPIAKKSISPSP